MVAGPLARAFFVFMALSLWPGTVPCGVAAEWTVLFYVNGADTAEPYGFATVKQIEKIGSTDEVKLVVQWNGSAGNLPQRFLASRDSAEHTGSHPMGALSGAEAGDWQGFVDFVQWGVANYPAKRYFILLRGALPGEIPCTRAADHDESPAEKVRYGCLADALKAASRIIGHKVDVVGADGDLGATIEVACELADTVSVFIASQETAPPSGWPYERFLERLTNKPLVAVSQMAKELIDDYRRAYAEKSTAVTLSALDLSRVRPLTDSLRKLSEGIMGLNEAERAGVYKAAVMTQRFANRTDADLIDFLRRLQLSAIKGAFDDIGFLKLLFEAKNESQALVLSNGTTPSYGRANGLSLWLPEARSQYDSRLFAYKVLRFDRKTAWSDSLDHFLPRVHSD
jgi:hypothetical protein